MLSRRVIVVLVVLILIGTFTYFYQTNIDSFTIFKPKEQENSKDSSNERLSVNFESMRNAFVNQEKSLKKLTSLIESVAGLIENKSMRVHSEVPIIEIFDLSQALEPNATYDSIQCRKSAKLLDIITHICIHNIKKDVFVSANIWSNGVWESNIVSEFLKYSIECEDCLIFDIGANIGQYSLYAAKLGRKVVAIEPFYDNILRLHKSSKLEGTHERITLVKNAISNVRNRIMLLAKQDENVGGQSLMTFKDRQFTNEDFKNPQYGNYLVRTILADDLVNILPLNSQQMPFKKAIMKIDIEGFEPYAFANASRLFNSLDFLVIFMEFMHFPKAVDMHVDVQGMIDFLYKHGLKAFDLNKELDRNAWKVNWPGDIIWKKI